MASWRKKAMPLQQWAPLQERFGELQMTTLGDPNLAMFSEHAAGDELDTIYIVGPGIEVIEAHSPGGWEDSEPPSGENLSLLVGSGDPWKHFRIKPPTF